MNTNFLKHTAIVLLTATFLIGANVEAAVVSYSQGELTSVNDILNVGDVLVANNTGWNDAPITLNGVAFGNSNAGFYGSSTGAPIIFSQQFAPGSPLDQLLKGMVFQHGSFGYLTLNLDGLTVGDQYLLQIFSANDYNTTGHTSRVSIQGQAYDLYDLGNTADYIRAVFTASANSELVTFGSGTTDISARMVVNAYALEHVVPVPEPETYAMILAGLGVMGFMVRRRKTGQGIELTRA